MGNEVKISVTRAATYANTAGIVPVTRDTFKIIIAEQFIGDSDSPSSVEIRGAYIVPADALFNLATAIEKYRPVTIPAPVSPTDAPTEGHLPGETFP